jgi:threonine dehydrogenase-like Zn-dependent dehydrogenase
MLRDQLTGSAQALWYIGDKRAELRRESLPIIKAGDALIKTLWSGISRGTERLVFNGLVPASENERMRGPGMGGDFPHPVKYGYCVVGRVEEGPEAILNKTVFVLHPHQDRIVTSAASLALVPENVPAKRAVMAANVETALNALWDSGAGPGDRIAVIGGGVVGCLIAWLAGQLPGADVTLIDPLTERAAIAAHLGVAYAQPSAAPEDCDIVFHASANPKGLATALDCAGFEASVIEVSWYGDQDVGVPLGRAFHSGRLKLISSQVGQVAASRRPRWNYARRMQKAMQLLGDPRLDILIGDAIDFNDAPSQLPSIFSGEGRGLAPVLHYR